MLKSQTGRIEIIALSLSKISLVFLIDQIDFYRISHIPFSNT